MKTLFSIALLFLCCCTILKSQEYTTPNVLSYYAMGNSIDGQPMVERANILRFYPVFALRDITDEVIITVYYGPYVYTDTARPMDDKHYWEARLPRFELGEAIQRIDVKTRINIKDHPVRKKIDAVYTNINNQLNSHLQKLLSTIDTNQYNVLKNGIEGAITKLQSSSDNLKSSITTQLNSFTVTDFACSTQVQVLSANLQNIKNRLNNLGTDTTGIDTVLQKIEEYLRNTNINEWKNSLSLKQNTINEKVKAEINAILDTNSAKIGIALGKSYSNLLRLANATGADIIAARDTLRSNIANESYEQIADTNYSGPSVKKGDVIIDSAGEHIHILYRNHKTSLRQLPALDPVESMGLFRIRYIPFVVAGKSLLTTFTGNSSAVFEVGLAFGDVRVSGDDFVKPELSIRRLGVAFAITNRLFSDDARIRALALTYDFNSYGSIAAGVNFPGKDVAQGIINESYISFGINKRAFEQTLKSLVGLF